MAKEEPTTEHCSEETIKLRKARCFAILIQLTTQTGLRKRRGDARDGEDAVQRRRQQNKEAVRRHRKRMHLIQTAQAVKVHRSIHLVFSNPFPG